MNTTNYILELLISGITTFTWITLLFLALFGHHLEISDLRLNTPNALIIIFVLAPFCYIFGTISDRISEMIWDSVFGTNSEDSVEYENRQEWRSLIYINSEQLTGLFEYGKLRVRICRSWVFNGTLIFITAPIYIYSKASLFETYSMKLYSMVFIESIILLSIIGAVLSIKELYRKEIRFLKRQSKYFSSISVQNDIRD